MPSDYEEITRHNERQLGLDTASRKTQICMYSDSTHFVYEILQNADDYGATEIFFKLSKDHLLIEHDGQPFTEENVKAITYFGRSTSRDDLVKTGRFGVGFKSVFAFTATPTVISGVEHFQIYGLYRVKEHIYPDGFSKSDTRIILPFNHQSEQPDYVENLISQEEAYSKISARLTGLNMNTLLFTRNIREIHWGIDSLEGHYLREDDSKDNKYSNARWTIITDGNKLNKYLVFSRVPRWKNQDYKTVEIAFAVDEKNQLTTTNDSLYVLFATTQETHLQFLLNGPYRTTPSRETISEEANFNLHLIKETCILMKEVLPQLRQLGLLTPQFLNVLPNSTDKLRNFYTPILDAIIEIFHEQELVPTDDNKFASSGNVFQGPAPLREVITREELQFFLGRANVCWAKGVQNVRADQFLRGLGIQQWGWEQLQNALNDKYSEDYYYVNDDDDYTWLAARSDSWLQKLYILLADAIRKGDCSAYALKSDRIIRVREGEKETHVIGSKAYFPKGRLYADLPQVKKTILIGKNEQASEKIHESLVVLGVSEIGDRERIDKLLETFYGEESSEPDTQQHFEHMNTFIKWWKKENNADKFRNYALFLSKEGSEQLRRKKPNECYLETPIYKTGIDVIYEDKNLKLPRKWKLWKGYRQITNEDFCSFAINCGVEDGLRIVHQSCSHHPNRSYLQQDYLQHNTIFTFTGYDVDYIIKGLSDLLQMKSRDVSHLIWLTMSKAAPEVLKARYRPNRQYTTREDKSSLIINLTKAQWIPNKSGHFNKPCELTKEQLHQDFKFDNDNRWLDEVGFGESAKKASEEYQGRDQAAKTMGFASAEQAEELAKLVKETGLTTEEIRSRVLPASNKGKPAFPTRTMSNPERRQEKLSKQLSDAAEKEYEPRGRSVRTTRGTVDPVMWLRNLYTNEADQMICQICREEMPFRKRDGEYYFETVEALSRDHLAKEHEAQFIALCPLCAAMYNEFIKHDESAMAVLKKALMTSDEPEIPLRLGELNASVRFVESHFNDIKTILHEVDGNSESK